VCGAKRYTPFFVRIFADLWVIFWLLMFNYKNIGIEMSHNLLALLCQRQIVQSVFDKWIYACPIKFGIVASQVSWVSIAKRDIYASFFKLIK
jgi:hypothetical protein